MSKRNEEFFNQLGIDVNNVIWYSNYLPYSIEQSEMDYVIIEAEDGQNISKIYVIEFMKETLNDAHIRSCTMYSKWVNDTLGLGTNIVQPIIVCKESYDFMDDPEEKYKGNRLKAYKKRLKTFVDEANNNNLRQVQVFTYDFSAGKPIFTRKK